MYSNNLGIADPLLSIISVNYNGFDDTCEMIDSLKEHLTFSFEVIVVDNASKVNDAERIRLIYPWVKCIRSEKNLGFAGGNNIGIAEAKGKYLFLLNNDTFVTDNSLSNLITFMDSNPQVGAVTPKLKFALYSDEIQFAGYASFSKITLRNHIIGYGEKDEGQYEIPKRSAFLHGAAMMVRKEVIGKAGILPDMYFLYYEELDWCERIKEAGYELWYVPGGTVYHKESKSVGSNSSLKMFYMTRNRLLFAWRNSSGFNRYLAIAYQTTIALPKSIVKSLIRGRFDLAKAALKGWSCFFVTKKQVS
ncbi:glycosyltransferase family 2 protein [Dysgonomonas sp. HDW5A]|uniref:glycosyltransferase family 2 protein n=1 Tax=Dysgonomonas sp. HDW5A TaxID=2714926 RepID=UPI001628593C|nr:glycosyltransferase family 2 protein [Dysgonomonas sp. HDW5A]